MRVWPAAHQPGASPARRVGPPGAPV